MDSKVKVFGLAAIIVMAGLMLVPGASAALLSFLAQLTGGSVTVNEALTGGSFNLAAPTVAGNWGDVSGIVTNNGAADLSRKVALTIQPTNADAVFAFGTDQGLDGVKISDGTTTYEFDASSCSTNNGVINCLTPDADKMAFSGNSGTTLTVSILPSVNYDGANDGAIEVDATVQ